jgi:hypothetical protein
MRYGAPVPNEYIQYTWADDDERYYQGIEDKEQVKEELYDWCDDNLADPYKFSLDLTGYYPGGAMVWKLVTDNEDDATFFMMKWGGLNP